METSEPGKSKFPLWMQILVGLLFGVVVGMVWPGVGVMLQPIGTAFVKATKMLVMPLVFTAVTLGVYRMGLDLRQLGRLGGIAFLWFYVATGISIALGIGLNQVFHPAAGVPLLIAGNIPQNLATSVDWTKFFLDMIPDNIVTSVAQQKIIPTLFFSVCFGLGLAALRDTAKPFINILDIIMQAMFKLTSGVMATAPFAVSAIMAWVVATQGSKLILATSKLIGTLYIGLFILILFFWLILWILKEKPFQTTKLVMEPLLIAFATASSEVTLPTHMKILQQAGIPNKVVSFVLPVGYSFNLDGSTLYQSLAVCFLVEAYGFHIDLPSILTILFTTFIASKGTVGMPGASLVVLAVILTAVGLPLEGIAMLAAFDRFMDMGRTTLNVFGNTIAAIIMYRFGGDRLAETETTEAEVVSA
ncbi:MAG: dicarboxylate/amino acid:cation symporter [Nitrospirota bacterium]